nr:olfactory receptor 51E1-like [Pelodiscus sinensis]|eukprot:XP_025046249.1 olfactory receptor 51E1-like [Pelodiscus sinensis]
MSDSNTTNSINPSIFILLGFPGLEMAHVWISIPFCIMYILAVLENFTILFIVRMESKLHEPMYYFLCMLAVTDLVLSTTILPKMLTTESGIFVAMAVDRFVAICHPLRHSTILTKPVVSKVCLAVVLRGGLITLPMFLLARQWSYCRTNIIPQPYCAHMAVVGLACGDIRPSIYYGLFVLLCMRGLDVIFIVISYIQILRAIVSLPTKDARLKTFGTCISHLCSILMFYIPSLFFALVSRFDPKRPHPLHDLINQMYYMMPPVLNPIIYGVRTKQIRDKLLQLFNHKSS